MRHSLQYYIFFLLTATLLQTPSMLIAQGKRPEVLIFGNGIDAYTAAVQSAKSKLNTVWILEQGTLTEGIKFESGPIISHRQLDAGIWAELLSASLGADESNDSIISLVKQQINPQLIINAMEAEISSLKHLSVIRGEQIRSVKKVRRNWRIQLTNRQKFTVRAVVDASVAGKIAQLGELVDITPKTKVDNEYFNSQYFIPLARTGVAVSDLGQSHPYTIPLGALIPDSDQNIFFTKNTAVFRQHATGTQDDLPLLAHIGQVAGAAAGYVAFYTTSSDKIDIRPVQGELLQYGARLLPFQDIAIDDPHFAAIQRIGATGLFQPVIENAPNAKYHFDADAPVSTAELRPTMNQLFSRSQIWFTDNSSDQMTLTELMELIKYIAHRGNELEGLIEKNWTRRFDFRENYDPSMIVTRRHVAVLLDEYCQPFNIRIDLEGRIRR